MRAVIVGRMIAPLQYIVMTRLTEETSQNRIVLVAVVGVASTAVNPVSVMNVVDVIGRAVLLRFGMGAAGDTVNAFVDLHVSLQVGFVGRGVVAQGAGELFEAGVDGVVAPQEGASAEHPSANGADVAVSVIGRRVVPQRRLVSEPRAATLEDGSALLVHRGRVTLQIVTSVRPVGAQRTGEQPLLL